MENNIIKFILDVGNSKIKMLAGELSNFGEKLRILKYVEVQSKGIKKNTIENPIVLSECITEAVKILEEGTGLEVKKVVLGIGGTNIRSKTKNIKLSFNEEKVITENHIAELFLTAERELKESGEQVLESEIYNIRVNNSGIVKNPVGLTGRELQGDIHLIFVQEDEMDTMMEVVNRAKLEVESIVLNPYASAKATLSEEDKNMGVALIDIGEGTTDIIIYKNNKLIYAKSLPLGGMHYVSDLEYLYKVSKTEAQEMISQLAQTKEKDGYILLGDSKKVSIADVRKVIDARTGDLVTFIRKTIEESGFTGYLGKGIYLTGGATKLDEIFDEVKSHLGYSVKRVLPVQIAGLEDVKPEMSVAVGILLEVMEKEYNKMEKERKKKEEQEKLLKETIRIDEEKESEQEPKEKKERFKAIKEWFSNFI